MFAHFGICEKKPHGYTVFLYETKIILFKKKNQHLEDVNINPTTIVLFCSAIQEVGI